MTTKTRGAGREASRVRRNSILREHATRRVERFLRERRHSTEYTASDPDDIKSVLLDMGALFAAFGKYLASRPDILCPDVSTLLAGIQESPPAGENISHRLSHAHGPLAEQLAAIDEVPCICRWGVEVYRARLRNGRVVLAQLRTRATREEIELDLELLGESEELLKTAGVSHWAFEMARAGFRDALVRRVDLQRQADAIEVLSQTANKCQRLRVPAIDHDLCCADVLVFEQFADVHSVSPRRNCERDDIGSRAVRNWLDVFVNTGWLPADSDCLAADAEERIAFLYTPWVHFDASSSANLYRYLTALAAGDSIQGCRQLLKEIAQPDKLTPPSLLQKLLHANLAPSRLPESHEWQVVASSLLAHWCELARLEIRLNEELTDFYRSSHLLTETVCTAHARQDFLADAVLQKHIHDSVAGWAEMLGSHRIAELIEEYSPALASMPQRVDDLLYNATNAPAVENNERPSGLVLSNVATTAFLAVLLGLLVIGIWRVETPGQITRIAVLALIALVLLRIKPLRRRGD